MSKPTTAAALIAAELAPRTTPSSYPEPFASRVSGREKRALGQAFGLNNFGVNLVTLAPGAVSSMRHAHSRQDEFIYILSGTPTLVTNAGETQLAPGMCAGFPAGTGDAHTLHNRSREAAQYLEVGDRTAGDSVSYPDDDLEARLLDGRWHYFHKNGTPY